MAKKIITLLVLTVSLTFGLVQVCSASQNITVTVNGIKVNFPDQQPFIDDNGRTMVPVRFVSEALGANVSWNGQTQIVGVVQGSKNISLRIGEAKATINGKTITLDTKAILKSSRTMVPLRFVSEALGANVSWDSKTSTVTIKVSSGYVLPTKTDLVIETPDKKDNSAQVDIILGVLMYKPLESQYSDLEKILASKFSTATAKQITDYVRKKKDSFDELPVKEWTVNNQIIEVGSLSGQDSIPITIWLPGVK